MMEAMGSNWGCLVVRSLVITTQNSCLAGSWLVQLVNFEKFQWREGAAF